MKTRPELIPMPATTAEDGEFVVSHVPVGYQPRTIIPTENSPGIFDTPLTEDSEGLAVRSIEYARMALPNELGVSRDLRRKLIAAGVDPGWADAGEFMLARYFLARRNVYIDSYPRPNTEMLKNYDRALYMAKFGDKKFATISEQHHVLISKLSGYVYDHLTKKDTYDEDGFIQALKMMSDLFPRNPPPEVDATPEPEAEQEQNVQQSVQKMTKYTGFDEPKGWAPLVLKRIPFIKTIKPKKLAHDRRPGFFGAFRFPHRALLPAGDGQAFATKRRAAGGSVLMDCSGSMDLTQEMLEELLALAPTLTMYCYSTAPFINSPCNLIPAIDRRRVVSESKIKELTAGYNAADGPALKWLSKQDAPRFWVSDAIINGVGGSRPSPQMVLEVATLLRRYKIRRFEDISDFKKFVEARATLG